MWSMGGGGGRGGKKIILESYTFFLKAAKNERGTGKKNPHHDLKSILLGHFHMDLWIIALQQSLAFSSKKSVVFPGHSCLMARDGYGSVTTWSVWKAGIRIQFYSQSLSLCSSSATGPPSITIQNSLKFLGFPALLLTLGVASGCKLLQGLWWISQPNPEVSSSTYISQLCSSSVAWELQGFTEG